MADLAQGLVKPTLQLPSASVITSHTHSHSHPAPTWIPSLPTIEKATGAGERTLWVVFVVMFLSSLILGSMTYRVPVQKRLFHLLTTFLTLIATLSYFGMAVGYKFPGHGNSFSRVSTKHHPHSSGGNAEVIFRQVFWGTYVDWFLTTPLILLNLGLLSGLNGANILIAIFANIVMGLTGLFAAYGSTRVERWGWYAMGCLAYLVIIWQLAIPGRRAVLGKDSSTKKLYTYLTSYTIIIWTLYPIVWALGPESRQWSVNAEILAYAVLDILAKPVFGFWLLWAHSEKSAPILEGFWSHGLSPEGSIRIVDDEGA